MVDQSVTEAVLRALNSGEFLYSINHTHIMMIPKKNSPKKVSDIRPISLYNIMYKLISKVIANKIKECMPNLISPIQSAFIKGNLLLIIYWFILSCCNTLSEECKEKKKDSCF